MEFRHQSTIQSFHSSLMSFAQVIFCVSHKFQMNLDIFQNCENVLTKLKYEIHHEGVQGIKKIRALIDLTNFSTRFTSANNSIVVAQTFGYSHYWNNENVTTSLNHRSGNPGYIKEKPILTGVLAYKDIELLKDDQVLQSMTQSDLYINRGTDEFSQFLTIMTASSDCENTHR